MANPFYVQPADIMPGLSAAMGGFRAGAEAHLETSRQNKLQAKREELSNLYQSGTPDEVGDFFIKNPDLAQEFDVAKTAADKMTREEEVATAWDIYTGKVDPAAGALAHAEEILNRGGSATESLQLAEMSQQDPEIAKRAAAGVLARYDTAGFKAYRESQGEDADGEAGVSVGAQEILEDGTTIQSMKGGGTEVYSPEGIRLKGKKRVDAIQKGRAEKVSNLRKAAGGKTEASLEAELKLKALVAAQVINATEAAKASVSAFAKLEPARVAIANIDEAIQLIDEGADTGVVFSRLPSVREASLKLDNVQARMGLDVIGNTTFGALSESELNFALSAALPKKLKGQALRKWLIDKKAAQEKLADYLEATAIYLGTPGNTVAGYLESKRNEIPSRREGTAEERQAVTEPVPRYREGQQAQGPDGQILTYRNGNWEAM